MNEADDRIDELEKKFAYLESAVSDLDGLVLEYGRRTERLEAMTQVIARRLSELGTSQEPGLPEGERPPHY